MLMQETFADSPGSLREWFCYNITGCFHHPKLDALKQVFLSWESPCPHHGEKGSKVLAKGSCSMLACLDWKLCDKNIRWSRWRRSQHLRNRFLGTCRLTGYVRRAIRIKRAFHDSIPPHPPFDFRRVDYISPYFEDKIAFLSFH